ncbi:MAG: glycerol-3-phosphate acyltransferase, partial [Solobacterium sp.]|nr:glycerol-3-phosphate acyltransferase [Solobacterium sp.]
MKLVLAAVISYLFGSVPWALVIGKVFYHKDIRTEGSGNPGATNAARVLGLPAGIAVTVLDALKGLISMFIAHKIAPGTEIYAGLACCIGHCFPLFAGFKGGKAVATSFGFFLGVAALLTGEWIWNFAL